MRSSEIKQSTHFHTLTDSPLMERGQPLTGIMSLGNTEECPLDRPTKKLLKRCFDIVFSLFVILLILSWMLPLLALLIKLTSKGSVFFVQPRTGYNNATFRCLKLRTMRENHEADTMQARLNDDRITWPGKYLRRFSLDELPQFYNVLIGDMSIVGPRPHMLFHTKEFSKEIENYQTRHAVRPGITGLSQVMGYRGEITDKYALRNRIRFDFFYLKNWSFIMDSYIIFRTIKLLLFGDRRAY
jgi:putative colanic acid biosysnthesis UDP-glucose lipid carrier transferase